MASPAFVVAALGAGPTLRQQPWPNDAILLQRFMQQRLASGILMLDSQRGFEVGDSARQILAGCG